MTQRNDEDGTHRDLGLFTDLYELTMMQGYLETGHNPTVTFSLFFRDLPLDRSYVVVAGLHLAVLSRPAVSRNRLILG